MLTRNLDHARVDNAAVLLSFHYDLDKFKETSMTHCGKLNTPKQDCSFFTMFILNEAVVYLCYDTITM
jgi:hypothetical protein